MSPDGNDPQFALPARAVRVTRNEEIAPAVLALSFRRPFEFKPGQVVAVTVDPERPPRYYSIASGAKDSELTLIYDLVPGGVLTPRLATLAPGSELLVSEPFGSFVDSFDDTWWVATGTGIAPFLSMARSGIADGKTLVHGGRTLDRFYFHSELDGLMGTRYVCCCSTEHSDWTYPGRLTSWLSERELLPRESHYMLCGSSGMVVEVRDLLIERGVPYEHVGAEIYF